MVSFIACRVKTKSNEERNWETKHNKLSNNSCRDQRKLIVGRKLRHITHVIYYNRISIILLYVTNYMQVTRGDQEKQKYGVRGHMNENTINGAPEKGWESRIALSNHYAWLQTRRWRTHERKRYSWGSEKRVENGELR